MFTLACGGRRGHFDAVAAREMQMQIERSAHAGTMAVEDDGKASPDQMTWETPRLHRLPLSLAENNINGIADVEGHVS